MSHAYNAWVAGRVIESIASYEAGELTLAELQTQLDLYVPLFESDANTISHETLLAADSIESILFLEEPARHRLLGLRVAREIREKMLKMIGGQG